MAIFRSHTESLREGILRRRGLIVSTTTLRLATTISTWQISSTPPALQSPSSLLSCWFWSVHSRGTSPSSRSSRQVDVRCASTAEVASTMVTSARGLMRIDQPSPVRMFNGKSSKATFSGDQSTRCCFAFVLVLAHKCLQVFL